MQRILATTLSAALMASALSVTAFAADDPSIDDIFIAAKAGRLEQAQTMIEQVLRDHPNSSKAHFVQSELFAREGKVSQARAELAKAEEIKPDDSFASARSIQELKSQLGLTPRAEHPTTMMMGGERSASHFPWGTVLILALAVGVLWMLFRRRSAPYAVPYNGAPGVAGGPSYGGGPGPGYGPGYGAPPGGGIGSGIAGGLASGLAVGAGVVAGEELAHHFMDGDRRPSAAPPVEDSNWQSGNSDMGGSDFGTSDSGSWDDSSGGGGGGGGGDDWT